MNLTIEHLFNAYPELSDLDRQIILLSKRPLPHMFSMLCRIIEKPISCIDESGKGHKFVALRKIKGFAPLAMFKRRRTKSTRAAYFVSTLPKPKSDKFMTDQATNFKNKTFASTEHPRPPATQRKHKRKLKQYSDCLS